MRLLVSVPNQPSILVYADQAGSLDYVTEQIEVQTGIPRSDFRLRHNHRYLVSPIPSLPDLSQLHLSFVLAGGGYYHPEDFKLTENEMHRLICRKCYCRNPYDRKTCRKCGHPDLRSGKREYRNVPRANNPARKPLCTRNP